MKNRSGSYKKILLTEEMLKTEGPVFSPLIKIIKENYQNQLINAPEFTTLYILTFLRIIHPQNYLQRFKPRSLKSSENIAEKNNKRTLLSIIPREFNLTEFEKEKLAFITPLELFQDYNLKGIPRSVHRAMIHWFLNEWNLVLSFKIPNAKDVLKMQAENKRILTVIVDEARLTTLILGKRDPLSFALHDLMHADQFYGQKDSLFGQLGFYRMVFKNFEHENLQALLKSDKIFQEEFEYVVSDMNAYIIHLLKSFKSAFTRAQKEDVLNDFLITAKVPEAIIKSTMNLNTIPLSIDEEINLKNYFENYTGSIQ